MKRTKKAIALAAFLLCAVIGGYTYRLGTVPREPVVFVSAAMQGVNGAVVVAEGVRGVSDEDPVADEAPQAAAPAPEVPAATGALSSAPPADNAVQANAAADPQVTVWASVGPGDTVFYGDTITYRGRVSGYEGTAYHLQWQRTGAEDEWVDMEGETKSTLRIVLNHENEGARYRLKVFTD